MLVTFGVRQFGDVCVRLISIRQRRRTSTRTVPSSSLNRMSAQPDARFPDVADQSD